VRKAAATLARSLAPLGLKVALKESKISMAAFERQPLESNRILLNGRPLEEWLGAQTGQSPCCDVCGPNDCRTVTVDGKSYESIPPSSSSVPASWPLPVDAREQGKGLLRAQQVRQRQGQEQGLLFLTHRRAA
jgi:hypothetical protein